MDLRITEPRNFIKILLMIMIMMIMFIMFLLLQKHHHCNPSTRILKSQTPADAASAYGRSDELLQLLRRTTMGDRKVIVTMVAHEWGGSPGSILDLFLQSFRVGEGTEPLLNHLLIVALDIKAFLYCKSVHPHCFYLSSKRYAISKQFSLPHLKFKFWKEIIELGYNIVFTDAEVMWLRNPISRVDASGQLTMACDVLHSGGADDLQSGSYINDEGFFHLKSDAGTLEYFRYQDMVRVLYPDLQNRSLCEETIVRGDVFEMFSLKLNHMRPEELGGICQENLKMDTIRLLSANCCDDTESKVHDLKLLLEDWKISLKGSSSNFTWTAPSKCKGLKKTLLI